MAPLMTDTDYQSILFGYLDPSRTRLNPCWDCERNCFLLLLLLLLLRKDYLVAAAAAVSVSIFFSSSSSSSITTSIKLRCISCDSIYTILVCPGLIAVLVRTNTLVEENPNPSSSNRVSWCAFTSCRKYSRDTQSWCFVTGDQGGGVLPGSNLCEG